MRTAEWVEKAQPYEDKPDRFDSVPQVLCSEPLGQRCDVEFTLTNAAMALAYNRIDRKGSGDEVVFGSNDKSWSLEYDQECNAYVIRHDNEQEKLPPPPPGFDCILMSLDRYNQTLIFQTFTFPQSLVPWYKYRASFTNEDLYIGFRVPGPVSSATLTFSDCCVGVSPA